jgi:hypothetical protein
MRTPRAFTSTCATHTIKKEYKLYFQPINGWKYYIYCNYIDVIEESESEESESEEYN